MYIATFLRACKEIIVIKYDAFVNVDFQRLIIDQNGN